MWLPHAQESCFLFPCSQFLLSWYLHSRTSTTREYSVYSVSSKKLRTLNDNLSDLLTYSSQSFHAENKKLSAPILNRFVRQSLGFFPFFLIFTSHLHILFGFWYHFQYARPGLKEAEFIIWSLTVALHLGCLKISHQYKNTKKAVAS